MMRRIIKQTSNFIPATFLFYQSQIKMGNINNKRGLLVANSNHLIDLVNLQGRENLVHQHQINAKLEALSKQVIKLQSDLERSQTVTKNSTRPKSEFKKPPTYTRQDGKVGHQKQRRTYSIRNAIIDPEFLSGNISSE